MGASPEARRILAKASAVQEREPGLLGIEPKLQRRGGQIELAVVQDAPVGYCERSARQLGALRPGD